MNLDKFNTEFNRLGAVVTYSDGWQGIDTTKVNADLLHAYQGLMEYGYANGLI